MKKSLLLTIAASIISAIAILSPEYANAHNDNGSFPHVEGNSQFPRTKRSNIRHTLRIHIPKNSQNVTQISVKVPETLNWSKKISDVVVTSKGGEKINTNVSLSDNNIIIAFNQPLSPDTYLAIDIKNIKQPLRGNAAIYRLFAKFVGSNSEISIGMGRFRVNL